MSDYNSWVDLFSCLIIFSFDLATYPWGGFQPDKSFYSFLELFPLISCLCGNILYLYYPKIWDFDEKMPHWASLVHALWYICANLQNIFCFHENFVLNHSHSKHLVYVTCIWLLFFCMCTFRLILLQFWTVLLPLKNKCVTEKRT